MLKSFEISTGTNMVPTATVRLVAPDGRILVRTDAGTGPVDATYRAINALVGLENELTEFAIKAITEGIDAQGEVTVRIRADGKTYVGRGADTDIVVASAKALMNALNRLLSIQRRADTEVRTNP